MSLHVCELSINTLQDNAAVDQFASLFVEWIDGQRPQKIVTQECLQLWNFSRNFSWELTNNYSKSKSEFFLIAIQFGLTVNWNVPWNSMEVRRVAFTNSICKIKFIQNYICKLQSKHNQAHSQFLIQHI